MDGGKKEKKKRGGEVVKGGVNFLSSLSFFLFYDGELNQRTWIWDLWVFLEVKSLGF